MTDLELWNKASIDSRDAADLFLSRIEDNQQLVATIDKILRKLRAATAAMESLHRRSMGVPAPKIGD